MIKKLILIFGLSFSASLQAGSTFYIDSISAPIYEWVSGSSSDATIAHIWTSNTVDCGGITVSEIYVRLGRINTHGRLDMFSTYSTLLYAAQRNLLLELADNNSRIFDDNGTCIVDFASVAGGNDSPLIIQFPSSQ